MHCCVPVGVNGLVHSVEKIEENHVKAQKSFHRWADSYDKSHVTNPWPRNVAFHHSSLVNFQSQIQYDMVPNILYSIFVMMHICI